MLIFTLIVTLLISVPAIAGVPVKEESYKKAVAELEEKGSVPLINALSVSEGKGHLEGIRFHTRIVGGEDAEIKGTPWQVSIVAAESTSNLSGHFCGGSLIKPNWVLTAAHCVSRGTTPDQIDIISGTDDLRSGGKRSSVKQIIIHGKYNANTNDNDVALLKLARRVKASSIRTPIRLITAQEEKSKVKAGDTVLITGWGYTKENGEVSPKLQRATVPVVDRKTCNAQGAYDGAITDNMLCAGHQEGGVDSCQGDSGGPLAVKVDDDVYALAGVVSWGEGCAREDKPGVYARVSKYVKWINDHTK